METIAPAYGWDVACIPCHRYAIGQGKQGWCFAAQVNTDNHGQASWVPLACLQMTLPTKGSKDLMAVPHFVTGMNWCNPSSRLAGWKSCVSIRDSWGKVEIRKYQKDGRWCRMHHLNDYMWCPHGISDFAFHGPACLGVFRSAAAEQQEIMMINLSKLIKRGRSADHNA